MRKKGDNFQYGGPRLLVDRCLTPDGMGHFTAISLPEEKVPEGRFLLSTRRGKQFNSIVLADKDPLTGARRDDIIMSAEDAESMGLKNGDAITLRNEHGRSRARAHRPHQAGMPAGALARGERDHSGRPARSERRA